MAVPREVSDMLQESVALSERTESIAKAYEKLARQIDEARTVAERLRGQGIPAELELSGRSDAEAAKLAQQRGIQTVMRVGADGGVAEKSV